ncbi:MAG: SDR family oxidoreductase [Acidimicrobiales bacterium]
MTPPRVALITGGSSGIGLACGRMLKQKGYDVVLSARRAGPLQAAAEAIGARWAPGDSAEEAEVETVVARAGHLDLVIHAAGVMAGTFVRKERAAAFDAVVRTNLRSAFVVAAACLPHMGAGGRFIFVSSSSAHSPQPGKAAYSASKAGLNAFAGALAGEVERDGISVHVVTPAPVATPMLEDVHFPMISLDPDDVARAIVWLDELSPAVVLPELQMRATTRGPFAPAPFVPAAARALGRTDIEEAQP